VCVCVCVINGLKRVRCIRGAEGNPIARLCESLGLHTQQVPAERCLLFDHSGRTVPKHVEQQAQTRYLHTVTHI
jgi:hypothetical protein